MRLGDCLSKPPTIQYEQVEQLIKTQKPTLGKSRKINCGQIAWNCYCKNCNDIRSFISSDNIHMILVTESLFSVDARLACPVCHASVPAWFLVSTDGNISAPVLKVRIIKQNIQYTETVLPPYVRYGLYAEPLMKAEQAFREKLGAGSIVYLRKIFESITFQTASENNIVICDKNNQRLNFKEVLRRVCEQLPDFMPQEFSHDGYKLFSELSDVVHGEFDEREGLKKYPSLLRLVRGILDKQLDRKEMTEATKQLGWDATSSKV